MANEATLTMRLPADLMARVEALEERMRDDPELAAAWRVTRSSVVRLALVRGLEVLEAKYPAATGRNGRDRTDEQPAPPPQEAETGVSIWVRNGAARYRLNSDATRAGVRRYLALLDEHQGELAWQIGTSRTGRDSKVLFGPDAAPIKRFPLYLPD